MSPLHPEEPLPDETRAELQKYYENDKHPTPQMKELIAKKLKLPSNTVDDWFSPVSHEERVAEKEKANKKKRAVGEKRVAEDRRAAEEERACKEKKTAKEKRAAEKERVSKEKRAAEEKRAVEQTSTEERSSIAGRKRKILVYLSFVSVTFYVCELFWKHACACTEYINIQCPYFGAVQSYIRVRWHPKVWVQLTVIYTRYLCLNLVVHGSEVFFISFCQVFYWSNLVTFLLILKGNLQLHLVEVEMDLHEVQKQARDDNVQEYYTTTEQC